MNELTKAQIEQQDRVDNAINDLILELFEVEDSWDIALIGGLRDLLIAWAIDNVPGFDEFEFYPWVVEDEQ